MKSPSYIIGLLLFLLISVPVFADSGISHQQSAVSSQLKRVYADAKPLVPDNRQLKGFFEKKSVPTTILNLPISTWLKKNRF